MSAQKGRCARELMMEKNFFPLTDAWPRLQESRRDMSPQEDVSQESCDACPRGFSSPPGWLAHPRR
jgi:hypothetical protein